MADIIHCTYNNLGFWTILPRIFCYKFGLYSTWMRRYISIVPNFPKFQFLLSSVLSIWCLHTFHVTASLNFHNCVGAGVNNGNMTSFQFEFLWAYQFSWIYEFLNFLSITSNTQSWTLNAEYHQMKFIFNFELMHFKRKEIVLNRLWKCICKMILRME